MNKYLIFKISSIWAFMLMAYLAPFQAKAAASWNGEDIIIMPTANAIYNQCLTLGYDHYTPHGTIPGVGAAHTCYNNGTAVYWRGNVFVAETNLNNNPSDDYNYLDEDEEPHPVYGSPEEPDPESCNIESAILELAGDADIPDKIWANGCEYNAGFGACYSLDGWVTKRCSIDTTPTGNTRTPDPTCTPENPCPGSNPEETQQENPTPEQIDESETAEDHPDYDHPSDTEPDVTEFDPDNGDIRIDMETDDECDHEIIIKPDGTTIENVSGTDCETLIYPDRDYGTDDIEYNNPAEAPPWTHGSQPGSGGSTGNTDPNNGNPTPTAPGTTDPDIDADDTPDVTCDPATEDCDDEIVELLSDIKELLNYDDDQSITDAETAFNTGLDDSLNDMESIGSDELAIDGFNLDNLVRNVLNLPTAPPASQDFVIQANFATEMLSGSTKEIRIENIYEKTELLRILLAWLFFMLSAFSIYHIMFNRKLA